MALINCPECGNQVSDKAQSCPNCGVVIAGEKESKGSGTALTTVQDTSKKLKLQSLIAALCIIVGVIVAISAASASTNSSGGSTFASIIIIAGFIWFVITRIRIWWHHG